MNFNHIIHNLPDKISLDNTWPHVALSSPLNDLEHYFTVNIFWGLTIKTRILWTNLTTNHNFSSFN